MRFKNQAQRRAVMAKFKQPKVALFKFKPYSINNPSKKVKYVVYSGRSPDEFNRSERVFYSTDKAYQYAAKRQDQLKIHKYTYGED